MKAILLVLIATLGLSSCQFFDQYNQQGSPNSRESVILNDATPPKDYQPTFILFNKPIDIENLDSTKLEISGIDVSNPNAVKIRMHLVDSNFSYISGASAPQFKNIWCLVADTFNNTGKVVKNYKIKEITENDAVPVALSIVLDHSGSMGDWRAEEVQRAIANLIKQKKAEDLIGIVKYDNKVLTEVPLTNSIDELNQKFNINKLEGFGGLTAIANGVNYGIEMLKSAPKNYSKAVVIFTDGWDNSSTINKDSVIKIARAAKVKVYGIDFGENINPDYMKSFADSCSGYYQRVYRTEDFKYVFDDVYFRTKNYYELEYNPSDYGMHKVKLKLCLPKDSLVSEIAFDNTPDIGSVGLLNIYFDFDKAIVKKESDESISSILNLMQAFPNMEIEIRGHTDNRNSGKDPDYNVKLSQKRADAVKEALVKKGIKAQRITAKGFGEKQAVSTNDTEEGRAMNRRTEFAVTKR